MTGPSSGPRQPGSPDSGRRLVIAGCVAVAAGGLGAGAGWLWTRRGSESVVNAPAASGPGESSAGSTLAPEPTAPTTSQAAGPAETKEPPAAPEESDPPEATTTQPAVGASVVVLCREAWRAAQPIGELPRHRIERLTVHHTAVEFDSGRDAPQRVRNFQAFHQRENFVDLAYHYVIDAAGNIYEARSTDIPGETFTSYDPTGHFLAVCDGNFEVQPIPEAQLEALTRLLAWASSHFGVSPSTLAGHKDYAATDCPGSGLIDLLTDGSLLAAVESYLAAGPPEMIRLCGPDATARIDAISNGEV